MPFVQRNTRTGSNEKSAEQPLRFGLMVPAWSSYNDCFAGAVAQLGERGVRNAKVGSSILLRSTFQSLSKMVFTAEAARVSEVPGRRWRLESSVYA